MDIVCLDFEGVLAPEVWQEVARAKDIPELMRTTKDEPDYAKLMRWRVGVLEAHGVTIDDIKQVVAGLGPLPGAREFIDELRKTHQVAILTDSFYEYITPLLEALGYPMTFAHSLEIDEQGMIADFTLRIEDQKTVAVRAFQDCGFRVIAGGDSYNDLGMIMQADKGILFRSTDSIRTDHPDIASCERYEDLLKLIRE